MFFSANRNPYNLRQNSQNFRPRINTMYHGTESISSLGNKTWDLVPRTLKEICDLDKIDNAIEHWKPEIVLVDCAKFLCNMSVFWKK